MEVVMVFKGRPPESWRGIPGVRAIAAEELGEVEGRFVLVVGDWELARRLGVGFLAEEEAEELLAYMRKRLGVDPN
ncbi:hypothetical protein [Pyrobaculum neutrophilum]|uniref:Uncharacterized protein n=1 Tax=Pyrobaculum neutrophilum (strain DSM 2338 / JCM 9278 / NBRC 100436 / V24Sta) TaxID=444157 RepID=B1YA05_PYRNV|nr:hypothetical protein [Pyrobaculum neutrophilum]ACB40555.1 conserved hypothetical protein [Pyrobaculum neutrophilum V24Sta]